MPKISVKLPATLHRRAKIKALKAKPPISLMAYVRALIERDLGKSRDGKRT